MNMHPMAKNGSHPQKKIAIYGMVSPSLRTGVGRYIESLFASMGKVKCPFDIMVLLGSNQRDLVEHIPHIFSIKTSAITTESSFLNFLHMQFVIPLLIKRNGIDLLHIPNEKLLILKTCPIVVTIHDVGDFRVANRTTLVRRLLRKITLPLIIRQADHIIAVSQRTGQDLLKIFKVNPEKLTVIHEGVSEFVLKKPSQSQVEKTHRRFKINNDFILFVGEISERKNLNVLLDAFRHYCKLETRKIQLVLAGKEGNSSHNIKRLLAHYKFGERVLLTGHITDMDLSVLYHSASCLVLPSIYEGFGLPALEAMACGLPVVVSNAGSLPEIVMDAGLVVDCSSAKSLSQALREVMTNMSLCEQLKAKGLQRAALFSWTDCANATLEVYKKVCWGEQS